MKLTINDVNLLIKTQASSIGSHGKAENAILPAILKDKAIRLLELLDEYNRFPQPKSDTYGE